MSDATGDAGWRDRLWSDRPGFAGLADEPLPHVHGVVIALAAVSGLIHLVEGVELVVNAVGTGFVYWLGISLIGAGVGFFVGVALVVRGVARWPVYYLAIPFTAGQVVVWYVLNRPIAVEETLGIVDKVIQIAMLAGLVALVRRR